MTTLVLPITSPVQIEIDPASVVVRGHRFTAKTTSGMKVSISLAEDATAPIIEMLAKSDDNSRPPTIVGQAPPTVYGELLRGALGLENTRSLGKCLPLKLFTDADSAGLSIQWKDINVFAGVSKRLPPNGGD